MGWSSSFLKPKYATPFAVYFSHKKNAMEHIQNYTIISLSALFCHTHWRRSQRNLLKKQQLYISKLLFYNLRAEKRDRNKVRVTERNPERQSRGNGSGTTVSQNRMIGGLSCFCDWVTSRMKGEQSTQTALHHRTTVCQPPLRLCQSSLCDWSSPPLNDKLSEIAHWFAFLWKERGSVKACALNFKGVCVSRQVCMCCMVCCAVPHTHTHAHAHTLVRAHTHI